MEREGGNERKQRREQINRNTATNTHAGAGTSNTPTYQFTHARMQSTYKKTKTVKDVVKLGTQALISSKLNLPESGGRLPWRQVCGHPALHIGDHCMRRAGQSGVTEHRANVILTCKGKGGV